MAFSGWVSLLGAQPLTHVIFPSSRASGLIASTRKAEFPTGPIPDSCIGSQRSFCVHQHSPASSTRAPKDSLGRAHKGMALRDHPITGPRSQVLGTGGTVRMHGGPPGQRSLRGGERWGRRDREGPASGQGEAAGAAGGPGDLHPELPGKAGGFKGERGPRQSQEWPREIVIGRSHHGWGVRRVTRNGAAGRYAELLMTRNRGKTGPCRSSQLRGQGRMCSGLQWTPCVSLGRSDPLPSAELPSSACPRPRSPKASPKARYSGLCEVECSAQLETVGRTRGGDYPSGQSSA